MSNNLDEIRILSIDGGGIRGIIPAYFLSKIEEKLEGKKIYEYFDIVAGTSTGGIIALAVACGIEIQQVLNLYEDKGKIIFNKNFLLKIKNLIFNKSLYSSKVLDRELEALFSDKTMEDLKTKVVIPSSIINDKSTKVFKTPHEVYYPKS